MAGSNNVPSFCSRARSNYFVASLLQHQSPKLQRNLFIIHAQDDGFVLEHHRILPLLPSRRGHTRADVWSSRQPGNENRETRYAASRQTNAAKPYCAVILLNDSSANPKAKPSAFRVLSGEKRLEDSFGMLWINT